MERVLLTPENIKDAAEFVDGEGDTWRRRGDQWDVNGSGIYVQQKDPVFLFWMRGAYVTRWLPGREPMAPKPEKWAVGYVLRNGDNPPDGTLIESRSGYRILCEGRLGPLTDGVWTVVYPPPAPPAPVWRKVVVEVSGDGDDAQIRFPDGGVFDNREPVHPSTIAAHAPPVPPRPSRVEVREAALKVAHKWSGTSAAEFVVEFRDAMNALLDLCCGKDGA